MLCVDFDTSRIDQITPFSYTITESLSAKNTSVDDQVAQHREGKQVSRKVLCSRRESHQELKKHTP